MNTPNNTPVNNMDKVNAIFAELDAKRAAECQADDCVRRVVLESEYLHTTLVHHDVYEAEALQPSVDALAKSAAQMTEDVAGATYSINTGPVQKSVSAHKIESEGEQQYEVALAGHGYVLKMKLSVEEGGKANITKLTISANDMSGDPYTVAEQMDAERFQEILEQWVPIVERAVSGEALSEKGDSTITVHSAIEKNWSKLQELMTIDIAA